MSRSDNGKCPDNGSWCGFIRDRCDGTCGLKEHEDLLAENTRLRERVDELEGERAELVGFLADIKRIAESKGVYGAKRIIDLCDAVVDVGERHDRDLHDRRATSIEVLRTMPPVRDWYRPYARSTYMRMPKEEIVEHLGVAFRNWHLSETALNRVTKTNLAAAEKSAEVKMEDGK